MNQPVQRNVTRVFVSIKVLGIQDFFQAPFLLQFIIIYSRHTHFRAFRTARTGILHISTFAFACHFEIHQEHSKISETSCVFCYSSYSPPNKIIKGVFLNRHFTIPKFLRKFHHPNAQRATTKIRKHTWVFPKIMVPPNHPL